MDNSQVSTPSKIAVDARRLRRLLRNAVSANLIGGYRSFARGSGLEFKELRDYQPGDETRLIDWKSSSRASRPMIKSFEEERGVRLLLALDVSESMTSTILAPRARQTAQILAALASENGDELGLCTCSDGIEQILPFQQGQHALSQAWAYIENAYPLSPSHSALQKPTDSRRKTNLQLALTALSEKIKQRCFVVLITDGYCPPFAAALNKLRARHRTMIALIDHQEDEFSKKSGIIIEFEDAESQVTTLVDNYFTSALAKEALERRFKDLALSLGGSSRCLARIGKDPLRSLEIYFRSQTYGRSRK